MAHLISCFALSYCTSFGLVPSVGALTYEGLGWRGQRWRRGRKKRNLPTHELCSHAKRGDGSSTLPHRKTWTSILKGGYQVFLPLFHTPTPHFSRKGERFTGLLHIIANLWTPPFRSHFLIIFITSIIKKKQSPDTSESSHCLSTKVNLFQLPWKSKGTLKDSPQNHKEFPRRSGGHGWPIQQFSKLPFNRRMSSLCLLLSFLSKDGSLNM